MANPLSRSPRTLPRTVAPRPGGRDAALPTMLALSLAAHVAVIGTAALLARPAVPKQAGEIAVEVVPELPEAKQPAADDEPGTQAAAEAAARQAAAAAKSAEDAARQAAAEQRAKQETAEAARAELARVESARAEQAAADKVERQSMRDELVRLQAEEKALAAEASKLEADPPREPAQAPLRGSQAAGLGPLASSFQAIALPQEASDGEGELVGYQAIVFSRLAKAKAVGRRLGIPGSAGVAFSLDERGGLASVRLAASSGVRALDDEALAIVRKAAPFPAPPEGARRSFEANVNFVVGQ